MDFEEWMDEVDRIAQGLAFAFYQELCDLHCDGIEPAEAWAQASEGWNRDEALSGVAGMLSNSGVPLPRE